MELIPLLRLLWARRVALAGGVVLALALAVVVGMPSSASSAVAWTRVGLDTPRSQLIASMPPGADTLPWRASLLTHLMTTDETRGLLAQRLGLPPDQVAVVDPILSTPLIPASMPTKASTAAAPTVPYLLKLSVKDPSLPVISIEAAAPDRAGALSLARAAVAILESQASSEGTYASLIPSANARRLQPFLVQPVADLRVKPVVSAVMPIKRLGAAVVVLGLWFAAVLLLPRRRAPAAAA